MVLDFYRLREQPFGVTPDPAYLFLSETHREALATLLYGVESGCGFVALIAKPGLGKTTLLFHASDLLRDKFTIIFLFQTLCTSQELLRAILAELGISEAKGSLVDLQIQLKTVLTEQNGLGKRVLVVIDEAQNLADSVLELVRMLSNFETPREKLIQVVLCGQPQLAEKILSPDLVQLKQRISMFARLESFSPDETSRYIAYRIRRAGYTSDQPLFTDEAVNFIAQYSEGVPRNINNVCFNSLALGCALGQATIAGDTVREVTNDLDLERWHRKSVSVVQPDAKDGGDVIPFAAPSKGSRSIKLTSKSSLALVLLLGLVASLISVIRWKSASQPSLASERRAGGLRASAPASVPQVAMWANARDGIQSGDSTRVSSGLPAGSGSSHRESNGMNLVGAIRVLSGRTFLVICKENFGSCDAKLLDEIHKLNPRLANLNHIEAGQEIRLPGVTRTETGPLSSA